MDKRDLGNSRAVIGSKNFKGSSVKVLVTQLWFADE